MHKYLELQFRHFWPGCQLSVDTRREYLKLFRLLHLCRQFRELSDHVYQKDYRFQKVHL